MNFEDTVFANLELEYTGGGDIKATVIIDSEPFEFKADDRGSIEEREDFETLIDNSVLAICQLNDLEYQNLEQKLLHTRLHLGITWLLGRKECLQRIKEIGSICNGY